MRRCKTISSDDRGFMVRRRFCSQSILTFRLYLRRRSIGKANSSSFEKAVTKAVPGSCFSYDAARNFFLCPAEKELTLSIVINEENSVRRHIYKAPKTACRTCALRDQCGPKDNRPGWRHRRIGSRANQDSIFFRWIATERWRMQIRPRVAKCEANRSRTAV